MTESTGEDGYEGVTVAGVCIKAEDTGRIFLAQRSMDETDTPDVQETWEFPGGHLKKGEDPFVAASREFVEEIGVEFPPGEVVDGWRAAAETVRDHYQGFVYFTPTEFDLTDWAATKEVQAVAWFDPEEVEAMTTSGELRPEIVATMDWSLVWPVSGNQSDEGEDEMDDETLLEEPDYDALLMASEPLQFHGVMAPEDAESGDSRGFNAGSITSRPGRLPFSWQKISIAAHDGSVVTGSLDRMMRKDGLIHYQGTFMDNKEADEFAGLLAHFGRFGVSIDGDKGSLDEAKTKSTGMVWYDAVRAAGLTAVAIPAFHEAYVAFGPHPDMPDEDDDEFAVMTASGDLVSFKRGPGWATNPKETKRIHDYWTKKGQPGYKKIAWGTPGDFRRAKVLIGEKIAKNSPSKVRFLNQIIAQWHFDALGYWPGELGKPGNAPDTPENRRRAATHAALDEPAWETVLVSSATEKRVYPPKSWFSKVETTDALVIEDPDENGLQHTFGYAGEWGICHVGFDGKCQEVPIDPNGGTYPWFHLGRTKVMDEDGNLTYVNTGLITYGKAHRSAQEILSETPTQAHYDDIRHAWAAVVIGEDERGVWFSGVVLPTVEEKWLTAIEASGQVSGEWKRGELRTLLTVNVAGFPVMRSSAAYDDDGNLLALSASALSMPFEVCEPPEDAICGYVNAAGDKCPEPATWGVWLNPDSYSLCCPSHVKYLQADHECADAEPPETTAKERIEALALIDAEERITKAKAAFVLSEATND
jgi:8-oxo-dGTP pyrophosphatase MutT (NUDIX family)